MNVADLTSSDVVDLILYDNIKNMYATDEKVQKFIQQYCAEGLCPDTDIVGKN